MIILSSVGWALPIGNPAEATLYQKGVFFDPCSVNPCNPLFMFVGGLDVRVGYYGDFTWNRKVEEILFGDAENAYAKTQMQTNAAYTVINIYNWMDVFATFGVSSIQVLRTAKETNTRGIAFFSPAFSWSVGTHATLYRNGPLYLGGMGQYFRTQPDLDSYFNLGTGLHTFFNNTNPTVWEEWQIGFGAALDLKNSLGTSLVPYAAIKISQGKFILRSFQFIHDGISHQLPNLEPPDYFGWAFGCTFLNQEAIGVTVEARFMTETAIFILGQLRF